MGAFSIHAQKANREQKRELKTYINQITQDIIRENYPELETARIKIHSFKSESLYFRAFFLPDIFRDNSPYSYHLGFNPKYFFNKKGVYYKNFSKEERVLLDQALRGVLAHELGHFYYYETMDLFRFLDLFPVIGNQINRQKKQKEGATFERWTDLEAIKRGYGNELLAYQKRKQSTLILKNHKKKKRNCGGPYKKAPWHDIIYFPVKDLEVIVKNTPGSEQARIRYAECLQDMVPLTSEKVEVRVKRCKLFL